MKLLGFENMLNNGFCEYEILLFLKAKNLEIERTRKWLKMISKWKHYSPGEKVSDAISIL